MHALRAGGSAAEQSALSLLQRWQTPAGNKDKASGWDFQTKLWTSTWHNVFSKDNQGYDQQLNFKQLISVWIKTKLKITKMINDQNVWKT